jgi:hypothetical protein
MSLSLVTSRTQICGSGISASQRAYFFSRPTQSLIAWLII